MKRSELIATLAWIIAAMAPDNEKSEEIFSILKKKKDMKVLHRLYMESFHENQLRETFFPEIE